MSARDKKMMSDSETEEANQLDNADTVTKYKKAAEIANLVLAHVKALAVPGSTVLDLTMAGDKLILEETAKVYKKKVADAENGKSEAVAKGVAFPTCVSINNVVCHVSPLQSDEPIVLQDGDVAKIDLGVHIDGYSAVVGSTVLVGASPSKPITGPKADVVLAAHYAAEAVLRMLKPGTYTNEITDVISQVADRYNVKPIEGMLSYSISRNVIDGEKTIVQAPTEEHLKATKPTEIEPHDVFAIDILMSTGDGKVRVSDARTTVYKKGDVGYQLKMKTARAVYSELSQKFTAFPFTLRAFDDERKSRMGMTELVKHQMVQPFPVLLEKDGSYVAQAKLTALVMPNGTLRITDQAIDMPCLKSTCTLSPELSKLLSQSVGPSKKSKKKANKKKETPAETEA